MNTLFVFGPRDFNDRNLIIDPLIDVIVDYEIDRVVTNDDYGFNDVIGELCFDGGFEFEKIKVNRDKFGNSANARMLWNVMSKVDVLLIFGNDDVVEYFAERFEVKIIRVEV